MHLTKIQFLNFSPASTYLEAQSFSETKSVVDLRKKILISSSVSCYHACKFTTEIINPSKLPLETHLVASTCVTEAAATETETILLDVN